MGSSTGRVLLATCADVPSGDEDGELVMAALARHGVSASWAVWTNSEVDWSDALVVLRSTWDYTRQQHRFLDWVDRLDSVLNPAPVVRWNTDKTYLADLAAAGVPTVPTWWFAPGDELALPDLPEIVIKPSVGSGSRGAGRFTADRRAAAAEHAGALHAAGRTVMVQPYLTQVDQSGEAALIYLDGRFSHAITKSAMLPKDVVHPHEKWQRYVPELLEARTPSAAEIVVAEQALAAVRDRFDSVPLYARVDLLPAEDGPVLVELELTEPGLFLRHAAGTDAADSFATALAARR